jgi:hypothetical protein
MLVRVGLALTCSVVAFTVSVVKSNNGKAPGAAIAAHSECMPVFPPLLLLPKWVMSKAYLVSSMRFLFFFSFF